MRITFVTRKFGNAERISHCDVLHFTPVRVARLFLDCNGVFAIKAYMCCFTAVFNEYSCCDLRRAGSWSRASCSRCSSRVMQFVADTIARRITYENIVSSSDVGEAAKISTNAVCVAAR